MCVSCSVVSISLRLHELLPARLLHLWNFPGKNTQVACHFLLQGIFLTQGSNPCLLHLLNYRKVLYHLSYQGSFHLGCFYIFSILGKNSYVQNMPSCPNQQQWDNSQEVRIMNLYENSNIQSNSLEYFK